MTPPSSSPVRAVATQDVDQPVRDVELYAAPPGKIKIYKKGEAPDGLATRRQLRAAGLRPGGHDPVAQVETGRGEQVAALYSLDLAKPKLRMTKAKQAALDKALAARATCPACGRRFVFCLPLRTLGSCLECHDGTPIHPDSLCTA